MAQRVVILGTPGAGKSTFALALAERTGLPLIHLDREFWQPGWAKSDHSAFARHVSRLAERDAWVMDGNYSYTLPLRLPRAEVVVWFDFPRWRAFLGVLLRWLIYRGQTRPDMGEGCPERLDRDFLRFVWIHDRDWRRRVGTMIRDHAPGATVIRVRSTREVARALMRICPAQDATEHAAFLDLPANRLRHKRA